MARANDHEAAAGHHLAFELANWVPKDDRERLPVYAAVGRLAAEQPERFAPYHALDPNHSHPGLLFGAVHHLLLGGADHPLAEVFPTVRWYRGLEDPAAPIAVGEAVERFVDFLSAFAVEVEDTMASHGVQTNEVGRLAYLSPAIAFAQAEVGGRAALVDLGCSAGLNLAPQLATTTYTADSGLRFAVGRPENRLQLHSRLHGKGEPREVRRPSHVLGIDLHPINLAQGDNARWLLALTWAEDLERFQRTAAAIEAQDQLLFRPELVRASMTEVDEILGDRFGDEPLVVVNSWSAAYLNEAEQRELAAAMARLASRRRVRWVVAEHPRAVPGLPVQAYEPSEPGATAIYLVNPAEPASSLVLGEAHPHGRWVRWEA